MKNRGIALVLTVLVGMKGPLDHSGYMIEVSMLIQLYRSSSVRANLPPLH